MRSVVGLAALALVLAAASGCARDGGDPPLRPGPPPPHVAAVVSLPSFAGTLAQLQALADVVLPANPGGLDGAAAHLLAELAGIALLDGHDPSRPMHAVVLAAPGHAPAVVLVLAVADRRALGEAARGVGLRVAHGWAVLGARAAVEQVAPWALTQLATRPPPRLPTVRLHPAVLRAAHPASFSGPDHVFAGLGAGIPDDVGVRMRAAGDGLMAAFGQADSLVLTAELAGPGVALELTIEPRADTALARFTALQRPSTFGMFARLPTRPGRAYLGGRVALGPVRPRFVELLDAWPTQLLGGPADATQRAALATVLDATSGEVAILIGGLVGMAEGAALVGLADPAAAGPALAALLDGVRGAGDRDLPVGPFTYHFAPAPQPVRIGGVPFTASRNHVDTTNLAPAQVEALRVVTDAETLVGQAGDLLAIIIDADARRLAADVVTAAGAAPPVRALPPALASAVDDAQARGDSLLLFVDATADGRRPPADGTWVSLGARGTTLTVHAGAGASQLHVLGEGLAHRPRP